MTSITFKKNNLLYSFIFTLLFFLMAHSYRFFNNLYSGDALVVLYQNDSSWQISIGRIFQPVYLMFRGTICNPWLISFIAIICMSLAVYFVSEIFEFSNIFQILLASGIFVCNITVISENTSYLQDVDIYSLALLLSVLGVWLLRKNKILFDILGIISFTLTLGLYQAYISVSISLIMLVMLFEAQNNEKAKEYLKKCAKYAVCLLITAIAYYSCWKIYQKVFNIWTSDSYNGLSSVGNFAGFSIWALIKSAYQKVFEYFYYPSVFKSLIFRGYSMSIVWLILIRIANISALLMTVILIIKKNIEAKTSVFSKVMQVSIIVLLPLGVNLTSIISKGMLHTLMVFSFVLLYLPLINLSFDKIQKKYSFKKIFAFVVMFCIIWNNIVFANQVYLKKSLQDDAAKSLMTNIVYDVEHIEGYEPGITPVAFVGSFEKNEYISEIPDMEEISVLGVGKTPLLYEGCDYSFLKYETAVKLNLTRVDWTYEGVSEMPCYPAEGSVQNLGGTIVVKISNQ